MGFTYQGPAKSQLSSLLEEPPEQAFRACRLDYHLLNTKGKHSQRGQASPVVGGSHRASPHHTTDPFCPRAGTWGYRTGLLLLHGEEQTGLDRNLTEPNPSTLVTYRL